MSIPRFHMDARGWIGLGCYSLVLLVLAMICFSNKELLNNDFFKVLATAIVLTGWNNGPVGWAYQATKSGTEAATSSARIAEAAAGLEPPTPPAPQTAVDAASQTADAAASEADKIKAQGETP